VCLRIIRVRRGWRDWRLNESVFFRIDAVFLVANNLRERRLVACAAVQVIYNDCHGVIVHYDSLIDRCLFCRCEPPTSCQFRLWKAHSGLAHQRVDGGRMQGGEVVRVMDIGGVNIGDTCGRCHPRPSKRDGTMNTVQRWRTMHIIYRWEPELDPYQ